MVKSMTAYASSLQGSDEELFFLVEIHSLNRKGLDIDLSLPKEFLYLDVSVRKWIGEAVERGSIKVRISCKKPLLSPISVGTLKELKEQYEHLAEGLGYSKEVIDFSFLFGEQIEESFSKRSKSTHKNEALLKKTIEDALKELLLMKEQEGKVLSKDIKKRLKEIAAFTHAIELSAQKGTEKYRESLKGKIETIMGAPLEEERLLREVAIFAEKIDITEEIIRLRSHIVQAEQLLKETKKSVGRTFDFLIQEMLRELNTIGSKSSELSIAKNVIASKAELEKIREQVQNIE